jgi:hypothetical protein
LIVFSRTENNALIDSIPLSEVKQIDRYQEALKAENRSSIAGAAIEQKQGSPTIEQKQGSPETSFNLDSSMHSQAPGVDTEMVARDMTSKVMQIKTDSEGHNSGRTYYIRANETEDIGQMIARLSKLAKHARRKAENKSRFERHQLKVRRLYTSSPFQYLTAVLIFGVVMSAKSSF